MIKHGHIIDPPEHPTGEVRLLNELFDLVA